MKLNAIVALATLALSSSVVLAAPAGADITELLAREAYKVEDLIAREFAEELETREAESEAIFARSPLPAEGGEKKRGKRKNRTPPSDTPAPPAPDA